MVNKLSNKELRIFFDALFKQHFKRLCFYAMSFVKDEELAKDIVHDVFINVWNHYASINFEQPMLPYLLSLVRNCCINALEHRKVKERHVTQQQKSTPEYEVEYDNRYDELVDQVVDRIDRLPDRCRDVMRLCFLELKSYKEVAELMNISVNTVKTHVSTGLKILREEFPNSLLLFLLLQERET